MSCALALTARGPVRKKREDEERKRREDEEERKKREEEQRKTREEEERKKREEEQRKKREEQERKKREEEKRERETHIVAGEAAVAFARKRLGNGDIEEAKAARAKAALAFRIWYSCGCIWYSCGFRIWYSCGPGQTQSADLRGRQRARLLSLLALLVQKCKY